MVRSGMMNAIKNYLKGISETNLIYIEHVYSRFKAGEISEQQAKALAESYMLKQKIGSSGYVTAVDVSNGGIKLAVHPYFKGRDIANMPFAQQQARQKTGYMEFEWKNPTDPKPRIKTMWMSYFEPWHWIVNAAPFLDEYPQLVDLAGIEAELAKVKMQGNGYAFIMDMRGTLLSHPAWKGRNMMDEVDARNGDPYTRWLIDSIRRARTQNRPEEGAGVIRYHVKEPHGEHVYSRMMNYRYVPEADFIIGVVTDLEQLEAPIRVIRNTQIVIMTASLLLSLLVVVYAVRPMTRSIDELAAAVEKIDGGNLDTPLPALGSDEIGFLASAFSRMTQRLVLYTNDLEHQVEERTQAIVGINEELAAREVLLQNILDRYRILFMDSPDAYLIIQDGVFVDCNRASEAKLRTDRARIVGRTPESFSPEFQPDGKTSAQSAGEKIEEAFRNGSNTFEWAHRRPDGSDFFVEVTIASMLLEGKQSLFVSWRDITERKRAEKELQAKNSELERFTYTVSHDLKSPILTIKSFSGSIKNDLASGRHDRLEADLGRISDAAGKMAALLDDLLKLSRAGRVINTPVPVDMAKLVDDVLNTMAGVLKEHNVLVTVQPDLPTVLCDRQRMMEVVQNLVENGIKYRGNQTEPRIRVGLREENGRQVFFVQDNGPGIEPKYHDNIFGLFNRLNTLVPGTGIGLALVKRIIEVHGGSVWVESDGHGNGSTFCFTVG
jgi:PAS domain S-box-containing protein